MSADAQTLTAEIITILSETGIKGADKSTRIASLNLAWIVHQLEQSHGTVIELDDAQLTSAVDVGALVCVLEAVLPKDIA